MAQLDWIRLSVVHHTLVASAREMSNEKWSLSMPQGCCRWVQEPLPVSRSVVLPASQWLGQLFSLVVWISHQFVQSELPHSQVFVTQLFWPPGPDVVVEIGFHLDSLVG